MRKILSFVFALIIASSTVSFSASASELTLDAQLISRGYPQLVLDNLSEEVKLEIISDINLVFAGAEINQYNEELGEFNTTSISENGCAFALYGQIPSSDLTLTWVVSKAYSQGQLNYFDVKYSYNWNTLPLWRFQDPVAVSWDGSKYRMITNSFYKVDKYDGYFIDMANNMIDVNNAVHKEEYGYAQGSSNGVMWYADLPAPFGITTTKVYGYGTFLLEPIDATSTGSTILYGHYVHQKLLASVSLNIFSYGSFTVTGSGYDEKGNQISLNW